MIDNIIAIYFFFNEEMLRPVYGKRDEFIEWDWNEDQDNRKTGRGRPNWRAAIHKAVAARPTFFRFTLITSLMDCIRCMYVEAVITNFAIQWNVLSSGCGARHNIAFAECGTIGGRTTQCTVVKPLQEIQHKGVAIKRVFMICGRCPFIRVIAVLNFAQHVVPMLIPCFGHRFHDETLWPAWRIALIAERLMQATLIELNDGPVRCSHTDV